MNSTLSKEEILDKRYEVYRNLDGNPPIPLLAKGLILEVMREYARQDAIEFSEWRNKNTYTYYNNDDSPTYMLYSGGNNDLAGYTVDELYDLYTKRKQG